MKLGAALEAHELALARLERQLAARRCGRERRAPGPPRSTTTRSAAARRVAGADAPYPPARRPRSLGDRAREHLAPSRRGVARQRRARSRAARTAGRPGTSDAPRIAPRSSGSASRTSSGVSSSQFTPAARMPRDPRRLGLPAAASRVDDQRALAPDARLARPAAPRSRRTAPGRPSPGRARARAPCPSRARCPRRGRWCPPELRLALEQARRSRRARASSHAVGAADDARRRRPPTSNDLRARSPPGTGRRDRARTRPCR